MNLNCSQEMENIRKKTVMKLVLGPHVKMEGVQGYIESWS